MTASARLKILPCLVGVAALLAACTSPPGDVPRDEPESPAAPTPAELPPGHPPLDEASGQDAINPPPEGSGVGAAAVSWTAPEGWVAEAPSSPMRRAQYRIGDDAECVVYYFGPGQGGGPMSNAERWADQFQQPDGRSSREVLKTEQVEVNGVPVLMVEVTGTYGGGMSMTGVQQEAKPGYMLLGAVAEGADANWFFKLTGPESTIVSQRDAFDAMIRSLRRGT